MIERVRILLPLLLLLVGPVLAQPSRTYTVRPGDTLFRIARAHDVSVEMLQRLNGMSGTRIRPGQVLVVESAQTVRSISGDPPVAIEAVTDSSGTQALYAASAGETVFGVAFRLGLPVDSLLALNRDIPAVLASERPLTVPAEYAMQSYRVRRGDTLSKIARSHGVSVPSLRQANALSGDRIGIGQMLSIPSGLAPPEPTMPAIVADGTASVYPDRFAGRLTSSGRPYDPTDYTVAHPDWALGTILLLENVDTGQAVFAVVADRMPVRAVHVLEVSRAVAEALRYEDGQRLTIRMIDEVQDR